MTNVLILGAHGQIARMRACSSGGLFALVARSTGTPH